MYLAGCYRRLFSTSQPRFQKPVLFRLPWKHTQRWLVSTNDPPPDEEKKGEGKCHFVDQRVSN